ncbi:MAG: type I restriction endonuclease subunit R [Elusimicrobia bacterium]|nr:type I restriction endonuclease subunit R [Elusimicrobiota bacterium]
MDISEKKLEASIEQILLGETQAAAVDGASAAGDVLAGYLGAPGGYRKGRLEDYDRGLCLDPGAVMDFIYATQPAEWEKLKVQHGADAKDHLLKRLASEVQTRGTLEVLRKGIKNNGCKFQLAYFRPASGLNDEIRKLYQANIFTVVRQLKYSQRDENSLDLAIFLNGLPISTAELKNPLTGQNVQNAIRQYKFDRDPREPLFAFGRCLVHFVVDPDLVYLTTHLQGPKTRFLPFNRGNGTGAGNPPALGGFSTAYLWERIWSQDSVLDLIQNFVHVVEDEDDKGRKTGKKSMVFPRYHQLDCVRRLLADAQGTGTGQQYLIQHSAGSGKSNSIAWLAHQLSALHDVKDRRVFDSIIVITDRRVLDRQLQRTVRQFEQTLGLVENIDQTSRQLKQALQDGKNIIVTTLQKFPQIVGDIQSLPGQRFAVIIDEAHSSQSGESPKSLKLVLSAGTLEDAELEDADGCEDMEDRIASEMKARGRLPNVSTFAFTATPKHKTLELFGQKQADGRFSPFSLYTMRQAIEEGFILDVLENYTTYKSYWSLLKTIKDDPRYDRAKATYLLKAFVDLSDHAISKKVRIMVEHFAEKSMPRIGGKAKAMIVTRSRLHAVRYKLAVDRYLKEKGYPFKAMVAFSGTVKDGGADYTEPGMNGFPESQTSETFKRDEYRILIVANKFQTGFDQPLLHTMYVDKKLGGVGAVQTLSRLNRIHPGKEETMVLDFSNEPGQIQKAFADYYDKTLLKEGTDPNLLYDLQNRLADFHFYDRNDVERFASVWFDPKATQEKLHSALVPVVDRFRDAEDGEKVDFRGQLNDFVRLYAFLSQVITFVDTDLEKLYNFGRMLLRKLPLPEIVLPVEIRKNIDMDSYRIEQKTSGGIPLPRGTAELEPQGPKDGYRMPPEELETLSQIIKLLNERFGTDFTEKDRVFIEQLEERLAGDAALAASVQVNPPENARLTFEHVVNDRLQEMMDSNFKFYKQVTDDPEFAKFFLGWLFERYYRAKAPGQP